MKISQRELEVPHALAKSSTVLVTSRQKSPEHMDLSRILSYKECSKIIECISREASVPSVGCRKSYHVTSRKVFDNVPLANNVEQHMSILEGWCMKMGCFSTGSNAEGLYRLSRDNDCKRYYRIIYMYLINFFFVFNMPKMADTKGHK